MADKDPEKILKYLRGLLKINPKASLAEILDLIEASRPAPSAIASEPSVKIRLLSIDGNPAIEFTDGDILLQSDSITNFLMHLSILLPDCKLPDVLYISSAPSKVSGEMKNARY